MFDKEWNLIKAGLTGYMATGYTATGSFGDTRNLVDITEDLVQKKREERYERSRAKLRKAFSDVFEYEPELGEPELFKDQDYYWVHGYLFRAPGGNLITIHVDGSTRNVYSPVGFLDLAPTLLTWEQRHLLQRDLLESSEAHV